MNIKKVIAASGLSAVLVLGGGAAAFAQTQSPVEGGTWTYGLSTGLITPYSNYWHGTKCHGSSVISDWGTGKSIDTIKGATSHAQAPGNPATHNKYYFRVC